MFNRKKKEASDPSPSYGAVETVEPDTPSPEAETSVTHYNSLGDFTVKDHFSLSNPTSAVRFVDDETLIFTDNVEQVTLEKKKGENFITAKQATVSSPGLMGLRLAYTLVTVFMTGLLFVFCVQLVLFLFLGLAIESGKLKF